MPQLLARWVVASAAAVLSSAVSRTTVLGRSCPYDVRYRARTRGQLGLDGEAASRERIIGNSGPPIRSLPKSIMGAGSAGGVIPCTDAAMRAMQYDPEVAFGTISVK
jgi:hypothetical protein